ncbi:hypothetical protein [Novosphingobium rosa]|uniref:hypothetical protein n=1 Tax=Novosphingobium rosa TaxID=76978 RepID=UPI00083631D4|nr:hypothetical protein [Novosphingobium rosa]
MTKDQAIAAGYTQPVFATTGTLDLELLIRPGTDYDSAFGAYDLNEGEMLKVNGWNFDFEDMTEEA